MTENKANEEKGIQRERYIADSAVFIMGHSTIDGSSMITVPSVEDEIKTTSAKNRYDVAKEYGLRVEMPEKKFLKEVRAKAEISKDIEELSKTDIEILAKALEYKESGILMTDDYAVQNIAAQLGIRIKGIAQKKIKDVLIWQKQCIGCKKFFEKGEECPICGSPMKKRRKRKL